MPSFEEEAFARARQLHRKPEPKPKPESKPEPKPEPTPEPAPEPKPEKPIKPVKNQNLIETLFRDRDKSLILLLMLLLADDNNDPSLLFALAYLLM